MFAKRYLLPTQSENGLTIPISNATAASIGGHSQIFLNGTPIGAIGTPIILFGLYDPDQMWFPFMDGVILAQAPPQTEFATAGEALVYRMKTGQTRDHSLDMHQRHWNKKFIRDHAQDWPKSLITPGHDHNYPYVWKEEGHHWQYLLPFHEFRRCKHVTEYNHARSLWDHDAKAADPDNEWGGEDDEEDEYRNVIPYEFNFVGIPLGTVEEWLKAVASGRYFIKDTRETRDNGSIPVAFERHSDWMFVRLRVTPYMDYDELIEDVTRGRA